MISSLELCEVLNTVLGKPKMKREDFRIERMGLPAGNETFFDCGWYINLISDGRIYLWKDLQLHHSTGHKGQYCWGEAPGYYESRELAEEYLNTFLALASAIIYDEFPGKRFNPFYNLFYRRIPVDKVKITVEVNGKEVPLDTISAETFQKVKEAVRIPDVNEIDYEQKYELGTRLVTPLGETYKYGAVDFGVLGTSLCGNHEIRSMYYRWFRVR